MIIDAYSHVCPKPLLEAVLALKPTLPLEGLTTTYLSDAERRIEFLDRLGIEKQVLTLVRPPMWLGMERGDLHRLTRVANESIAEFAARHPDRFISVAVMPLVDDEMMGELRRARDELDMKGVLIFSNIEGLPLDDESMWPLYEEAASSGLPIWIHPQDGHTYPWIERDRIDRMLGWPFETSLAMARLVFGGVVSRFPSLRFVTHHLGGMVPFYAGRIASIGRRHDLGRPAGEDASSAAGRDGEPEVLDLFRSFFADAMVTGWEPALRCGLDFFGVEQVVYGSDFPMGADEGEAHAVEVLQSIRELDLSTDARELILAGNARRLLGLDGGAP